VDVFARWRERAGRWAIGLVELVEVLDVEANVEVEVESARGGEDGIRIGLARAVNNGERIRSRDKIWLALEFDVLLPEPEPEAEGK